MKTFVQYMHTGVCTGMHVKPKETENEEKERLQTRPWPLSSKRSWVVLKFQLAYSYHVIYVII